MEIPPTCASNGIETVFEASVVDSEDLSLDFELLVFDADFPFLSEVEAAASLFEAAAVVFEALADDSSDLAASDFEAVEEDKSNKGAFCQ